MNETEIREIVRDEIDQWWKDHMATQASAEQQWLAEFKRRQQQQCSPNPNDGPLVTELKKMMLEGETA